MVLQFDLAIKNIYWPNNDPRGSKSVTKEIKFIVVLYLILALWVGRDSDLLRDGRSGDRIPVEARFSTPVQTGPGTHPQWMPGLSRGQSGRGVALTTHHI
jgi:hypothetical protein